MSIFTQVWLWSVAAFALGALLTVLLLVLPARKQVKELQRQLTAAEAAPRERTRQFTPEVPVAEPTRTFESEAPTGYQAPVKHESPIGYQPASERDVPTGYPAGSEREAATSYQPAYEPEAESRTEYQPGLERETATGYQAAYEPEAPTGYQPPLEHEAANGYQPESATSYQPAYEPESMRDPYDPEPARGTYEPEHQEYETEPEPIQAGIEIGQHYDERPREEDDETHESVEQSWFARQQNNAEETAYYNGVGVLDDERPASLFTPAPVDEEPPAYAFTEEQSYEEELAAERTQVLPKRQPRQAPLGGFDPPQPIEPSVRQVERREPVLEQGQNSGSLFEPAVPAGPNGIVPEPPPAREFEPEPAVPIGPFGPGSAMPKPGGGRPAEEFTVKASVTALRYCTEESPQFPRMVAEVWFRTATDAERVGFRPLG
ncbi:sunset domain-containing protein [Amycolatopsis magusensis]|uniref:sunset domain-containing protein n=1 Tax=Amycolatopsis magusensis TaxID=882444 RepID=UPI00378E7F62